LSPKEIFFQNDRILIINDSIFETKLIKPDTVDLVVTSPPYNVDIKYNSHDDQISYEKYKEFSKDWMTCCYKWLKDDGRFCLNIPLDKNKGGQQSVGADLTTIAKEIGFKYHSTIIWNEGNISRRTAWGSWLSASAPYVIAPVELIVVLYKNTWKKTSGSLESDILRQDFMDWTNGLWSFSGESKKRIGHPAPFPIELPRRCMKLFSFKGDTVLDPFLGSGTTLVASYLNNRKGIGIDIDPHYCQIALDRIKNEGGMGQTSITAFVAPSARKTRTNKEGGTQSDTILKIFRDHPNQMFSYDDIGEWIATQSENNSVMEIKAYEKIIRTLAKDGKITKIGKGQYQYE
jgi:site-specific DNA-methyltransferase (adenine-specific)